MVFRKDIGQFTEWKSSVCRRTIKGLMMVGVKILLGSLVFKTLGQQEGLGSKLPQGSPF